MGYRRRSEAKKYIAFANRLSAWLENTGVAPGKGESFAEIILASRNLEAELLDLMRLNPDRPALTESAPLRLTSLYGCLYVVMEHHVRRLRDAWPDIERRFRAKEREGWRRLKASGKRSSPKR